MILSRFFLNGASRDVHRCIADSHHLHARVVAMFPSAGGAAPRERAGVLHRLELSERHGTITLLVQSNAAPDVSQLPDTFLDPVAGLDARSSTSLEPLFAAVVAGARLRFRLRANPTRKIDTKTGHDGVRRNGRRVPLRGDEQRIAWLARKLRSAGLDVETDEGQPLMRQRPDGLQRGHARGRVLTHEGHLYEGIVTVMDAAKARGAVERGIGPGKAFGFGLLSLAPL